MAEIEKNGSSAKPVLIYDGDCGFCKIWIARWKSITGNRIEYAPYQEVAPQFPEIPVEEFNKSVWLIDTDGSIYRGAEAVFRSLAVAKDKRWMLWCHQHIPGFAAAAEWFYRLVARHRSLFFVLTQIFWGKNVEPSTYVLSSGLFLRVLALIFLIAFLSLAVQIKGLNGRNGILPAADFLDFIHQRLDYQGYWLVPSIFWFQSSDIFLQAACWSGAFFSILLLFGVSPPVMLLLLWMLYLSFCAICRDFLAFQWDVLLVETAALSIFIAAPKIKVSLFPPTHATLFLLRWLLFRLTFSSGVVKLLSGDPSWRILTSLMYHYETQPLPTWIGWYAHQLPASFQKASVIIVFLVEVLIPFLIFFPRRIRNWGCYILVVFQILIVLTGNYAFFNLLTICLCILLIDDASWPLRVRERFLKLYQPNKHPWPNWVITPFVVFVLGASLLQMSITLRIPLNSPALIQLERLLAPFRTINRYGLFAVMTTTRPEIILEGSEDGAHWAAYEFKYKPGDPARKPVFVAPHQPRLDWQMWFAALGSYQDQPWFMPFCKRLLEGSPEVLSLLAKNPFSSKPPRYLRAMVYQYQFTDFKTKSNEGLWWKREIDGSYCPVLSLRDEQLEAH